MNRHNRKQLLLLMGTGHHVLCARRALDAPPQRLAALESLRQVQWAECRRADTEMVVGRQRLEDTKREITVEGQQASQERVGGKCCLPRSPAPMSNSNGIVKLTDKLVLSRGVFERCSRLSGRVVALHLSALATFHASLSKYNLEKLYKAPMTPHT